MTFSKPRFNGLQMDFAADKYQATIIASRISDPATGVTPQPARVSNSTSLIGGRATVQVGDFHHPRRHLGGRPQRQYRIGRIQRRSDRRQPNGWAVFNTGHRHRHGAERRFTSRRDRRSRPFQSRHSHHRPQFRYGVRDGLHTPASGARRARVAGHFWRVSQRRFHGRRRATSALS